MLFQVFTIPQSKDNEDPRPLLTVYPGACVAPISLHVLVASLATTSRPLPPQPSPHRCCQWATSLATASLSCGPTPAMRSSGPTPARRSSGPSPAARKRALSRQKQRQRQDRSLPGRGKTLASTSARQTERQRNIMLEGGRSEARTALDSARILHFSGIYSLLVAGLNPRAPFSSAGRGSTPPPSPSCAGPTASSSRRAASCTAGVSAYESTAPSASAPTPDWRARRATRGSQGTTRASASIAAIRTSGDEKCACREGKGSVRSERSEARETQPCVSLSGDHSLPSGCAVVKGSSKKAQILLSVFTDY